LPGHFRYEYELDLGASKPQNRKLKELNRVQVLRAYTAPLVRNRGRLMDS
jgi:hypothetical protein